MITPRELCSATIDVYNLNRHLEAHQGLIGDVGEVPNDTTEGGEVKEAGASTVIVRSCEVRSKRFSTMTVGALQDGIDWSENERMFFTSPAKGILQLISSHLQSSNYKFITITTKS
ncbi:hypothetical protein H5410_025680 [Solanum commersonii]|uniref:Uncharacterized protein n=1 Tax=Solanum commersonii TaxID=4109 RepID=A0A9J5YYN1_SOLCO|nr:hypothetical protein H5410_025680 [Solanum commersonii]